MKPAVFLDRDGTLIREVHYIARPEQVEILPGVAGALRTLRDAGFACVVVTNQSAVGRGIITPEDVRAVQSEVERRLADDGAHLDAFYFSPHAPSSSDRTVVEHPDRKPGPGMLQRAAADLAIDLGTSWMVGDMLSDLLAGRNAGCRGCILVRTGYGATADAATLAAADHVAPDLAGAARHIVGAHDAPAAGAALSHIDKERRS